MWSKTTCPHCKSINLEPGTLCPTNQVYFRSEHTRFLRLGAADIVVKATLCLDCGLLSLSADTDEVKSLAKAMCIFAQRAANSE